MYYRLDCDLNLHAGNMRDEDNFHETLMFGEPVDENDLALPWPFTLVSKAPDALVPSDYYSGSNLMRARLIEAIRSCGVDNIQLFKAKIVVEGTSRILTDYFVVNIVGVVAIANLAASRSRQVADTLFFETLEVDSRKARGLKMFRLAEARADVIVNDEVAKRIKEGNFVDVTLEPLKDVSDTE